jgi:hydroxyacylglutathione hydrolase
VVPIIGPDARDAFLLADIEAQQARFGVTGLHNCTPDRFLAEGDTVVLGKLTFDVLHCPGHSPGSLVYVEKARRFALVGDVIFRGSVGRTDLPYGDQAALIAAIHDKLLPLGDDIAFVCGHGPGSTFGAERRSNPFLQEARKRSDR